MNITKIFCFLLLQRLLLILRSQNFTHWKETLPGTIERLKFPGICKSWKNSRDLRIRGTAWRVWHGNGNSDSRDASVQGRDAARRGRRRDATGLDCLRRPEDPNRFSQLMELISGDSVSLSGRSTPLNPLSSSLEKKKENSPLYLHYNGSTSFFLPSARFSVLTSRRRFDRRIRLTRRTSSPGIKNGVEGGGRGGRQCQSNTAEERILLYDFQAKLLEFLLRRNAGIFAGEPLLKAMIRRGEKKPCPLQLVERASSN